MKPIEVVDALRRKIRELEGDNARLREALVFYADRKSWLRTEHMDAKGRLVSSDIAPVWQKDERGRRARKALAKPDTPTGPVAHQPKGGETPS